MDCRIAVFGAFFQTLEDFGWKQALSSRDNVSFVSYPKLNHLFMTSDGKSTPAEYFEPGNVAEEVVREIAEWVGEIRTQ